MKLLDKVVVITGGSRGLGLEMARAFAGAGAHLVIASRKLENCERVAKELFDAHGIRAIAVEFNVSHWAECDQLIDRCHDEFGRVDVLVNNAGLSPVYPSLGEVTEALWDKTLAVNIKGPFRLATLTADKMAAGDGGAIINVSSIEAVRPTPRALPYAIAKAGVNAMTRGLAEAYGPSVRVNTIQCGPFLTDISEHWDAATHDLLNRSLYLKRPGRPSEIIGAALYLASDDSSFVTGSTLAVDGGFP